MSLKATIERSKTEKITRTEIQRPFQTVSLEKRPRILLASGSTGSTTDKEPADWNREGEENPIIFWGKTVAWPKKYFEREISMAYPFARKRLVPSSRQKESKSTSAAPTSTTSGDPKPREEESAPYKDAKYENILSYPLCI